MEKLLPLRKNVLREYAIYGYFMFLTLANVWGLNSTDKLYYVLVGVAVVCWGFSQLLTKLSVNYVIKCVAIMALPLINFYYTHYLIFIILGMSLIALKDFEPNHIIKLMGKLWISFILLALLGTLVGLIKMNPFDGETGYEYRWFYNGSNPFHIAIVIFFMYYFIIRKEIKWFEFVIIFALNIGVYKFTISLGGLLAGIIVIVGFAIRNYTKQFDKLWKCFSWVMIILSYASVLLFLVSGFTYKKGNYLSDLLDKVFTNRIHTMRYILDAYPLTLFGHKMDGRAGYEMMDNAFFNILVSNGVVILLVILVLYGLLFYKLYKKKMYTEIMICTMFFAYGAIEQMFRNCFMNFTLLYFGYVIWKCGKEDERKNDI